MLHTAAVSVAFVWHINEWLRMYFYVCTTQQNATVARLLALQCMLLYVICMTLLQLSADAASAHVTRDTSVQLSLFCLGESLLPCAQLCNISCRAAVVCFKELGHVNRSVDYVTWLHKSQSSSCTLSRKQQLLYARIQMTSQAKYESKHRLYSNGSCS